MSYRHFQIHVYKFCDDDMTTFVWRKMEKKPENIYREALQII